MVAFGCLKIKLIHLRVVDVQNVGIIQRQRLLKPHLGLRVEGRHMLSLIHTGKFFSVRIE
ncbi:hypothetical protein WJ89_08965 [Burkholderia ubonensis]|nr:hypothetical protein WJ89_08965 [Burkholderia ubonensis]KVQ73791.1 hypothetical protein WK06_21765 [Burkholderia ubonensis]KWD43897.1 hypothetical protein WL64_07165 [Burkholderia ubonensis]KWD46357.1 hypothetical protein WL63_29455 [Burkholderia ubonensis]KWO95097.1 hypothetical protein WM35_21340 [Burkholderia ubonensis]